MGKREMPKTQKSKKSKIIVAIIVLIVLLLAVLTKCSVDNKDNVISPPTFNVETDANAGVGETTKPNDKLVEELNQKVADGMINISMNTNPVFESGTASGNLLIVNEKINKHPQVVEIYRDDTKELIYRSGGIPVGKQIDSSKLDVVLPKGEYPCTAYFNSVNAETGEALGKAGAKITILVKN